VSFPDGVLIIDKPPGPTSHDVVAVARRAIGHPAMKVGHTGTLDPLASGVLPLVLGRATRLAQFLSSTDKEYEAEIRLGNPAAAAALINKTRVGNGELPPVTAAGVPPGPGCVPKRYDGACGSLFDALMYEKRIETYGTAIAYFDLRGWGCLLEGTPTQLPPPGRQLDLLGKVNYTYGGSPGAVGSAPKPTNCPLLHRP